MALGGGTFLAQNKVLPGAYINFVSAAAATAALSDRGYVTMPLELDWGMDQEVFTVTNEDFHENAQRIFGYAWEHEKMKGLRDLFMNASTLYAYRLNGGGKRAANDYATAKCSGIRGNDLAVKIQENIDEPDMWDVITYLGTDMVDYQTVSNPEGLSANDYVDFKDSITLEAVACAKLSGGENGTVTGTSYQDYADRIESYVFNTMGIVTTDDTVKKMFASLNRRLRDEMGIKFQLVVYNYAQADCMGVISVKNKCLDGAVRDGEGRMQYPDEAAAVYWTTGAEGGCKVNASCQNRVYDGEYCIDTAYTQVELIGAIRGGEFVFHSVNQEVCVLEDVNTMVTTTENCGDVFKDNQTIRVIDQLANDDAVLFKTKYLGRIPNDDAGRSALWSDLVKIRKDLQTLRAIEDFVEDDVSVELGDTKKAVVVKSTITVVNAMSKMYMTVTVG